MNLLMPNWRSLILILLSHEARDRNESESYRLPSPPAPEDGEWLPPGK